MKIKALHLLKLCAFFVFIARAYQFYFFGAPYRALLWDESLLSPIVEGLFNTPWYDYATSEITNRNIEFFTKVSSFILLLAGIVSLFWSQLLFNRLKKIILGAGLFILLILGICLVKDKNYDILQLFELSIQFAAPLALLFSKNNQLPIPKLLFWLKVAIALTFIPHGLFAMGLIYVPGHFIDMTIQILGVTEDQARLFLFVIGALDVIAALLLFVPKASKYALVYIIVWGILTAFARIVAGYNLDFFSNSLHHYTYLTVYRLPHGLLPLAVYMIQYGSFKQRTNNIETKPT